MNLTLYSTKSEVAGYRLEALELLNWGTFDSDIFRIEPNGENTLLTGENSSGKTTLVDGLLTILAPEKKTRHYNQTAGDKGERTEESYVLGVYGEADDGQIKEVKKLRPDKSKAVSVLLSIFKNESDYVTLVQVRWFSNNELKRSFIIAYKKLTIKDDFSPIDTSHEWKKRLKQKYPKFGTKDPILIFDTAKEYSSKLRYITGMQSEKAQILFSNTIGLKVLGNLDEFIRQKMLEERNAEEEFQKLRSYFKTLSDAHKAIEKANKQIELLKPVKETAVLLEEANAKLYINEELKNIAPYWFGKKGIELINSFIEETQAEISGLDSEILDLDKEMSDLSVKEREIDLSIREDKAGKQITSLEKQVTDQEVIKSTREAELKKYNVHAKACSIQQNPEKKELFDRQRKEAINQKKILTTKRSDNQLIWINKQAEKQGIEQQYTEVINELTSLRSQKSNLPSSIINIRQWLLKDLGVTEKELPFTGELIRVKADEKEWEDAIERLLHSFGQRLIVPEKYYAQVNKYVNDNDLKGRLVYIRYNPKDQANAIVNSLEKKLLVNKIEFKPSEFSGWLFDLLGSDYRYICTEDLSEFKASKKAVMKSGLIKSGNKHEKDDRPDVRSRQNYILGWDNREKIAAIKESAENFNKKIGELDRICTDLGNTDTRYSDKLSNLDKIIDFDNYQKIDWWSIALKIKGLQDQITDIQQSNSKLNSLKQQKTELLKSIDELKAVVTSKIKLKGGKEVQIEQEQKKLQKHEEVIKQYQQFENLKEQSVAFEKRFKSKEDLNITNYDTYKDAVNKLIQDENKILNDQVGSVSNELSSYMRAFRLPEKEILDYFPDWNSDTYKLNDKSETWSSYVAILDKIEKEEIAQHKAQFKKYLNDEMITRMSDFKAWLDKQETDIFDIIKLLNKSLSRINFTNTPPTYIQLQADKDYSPKVANFRRRMNNWKPNILEFERTKDEKILEESFIKIKDILEYLTQLDNGRQELLDVRNWIKFKAVELYRDGNQVHRSYTGTGSLAGGESAQLTYTILGSAIAYQFGIHSEGLNRNSFRFICVDEAFSKQDANKANYLMELCKQLHLQVMIVSPAKMEDVAVVERHIAGVHFVKRKDNRNSFVYDMPIEHLQAQRSKYLQAVEK